MLRLTDRELRHLLEQPELDLDRVTVVLDTAAREKVKLDAPGLAYAVKNKLGELMEWFQSDARNLHLLRRMDRAIAVAKSLPFEVDLWRVQNIYFELLQTVAPEMHGDRGWTEAFMALGEKLNMQVEIRVPELPAAA